MRQIFYVFSALRREDESQNGNYVKQVYMKISVFMKSADGAIFDVFLALRRDGGILMKIIIKII